ncbi:MAG: VanZ family protein [Burkholderiales bacterium]
MTLLQVWAAWNPSVGQFAAGRLHLHALAHFGSYALLAIAWACALPEVPLIVIGFAVIAFGVGQEALEVFGHLHNFERHDVLIDALGALAGALVSELLR